MSTSDPAQQESGNINGLYYFHDGGSRGDIIYPNNILDLIKDTHDEIRESMERIQLLERELKEDIKIDQRARSAREFLKGLAAKYDGERGIRGDVVYATALRTLNVDLGLKRKIASQDPAKKKKKRGRKKSLGSEKEKGQVHKGVREKKSSSRMRAGSPTGTGGKGSGKKRRSSSNVGEKNSKHPKIAASNVSGVLKQHIEKATKTIPKKDKAPAVATAKMPTGTTKTSIVSKLPSTDKTSISLTPTATITPVIAKPAVNTISTTEGEVPEKKNALSQLKVHAKAQPQSKLQPGGKPQTEIKVQLQSKSQSVKLQASKPEVNPQVETMARPQAKPLIQNNIISQTQTKAQVADTKSQTDANAARDGHTNIVPVTKKS